MIFHNFSFLGLCFIILPLVLVCYFLRRPGGSVRFSSLDTLRRLRPSISLKARHILIVLRALTLLALIIALARPQKGKEYAKRFTEGREIILALDISGSMRAEDLGMGGEHINRLQVVKEVVRDFIKRRENDRIGMVVFAGFAYTQCPMTLDYGVLLQFLDKVEIGMIEDGTAIGSAIATSIGRLYRGPGNPYNLSSSSSDESSSISEGDEETDKKKRKGKIIILLTDGINNAGKADPITAAEIAKTLGIKIYTIGAGTDEPFALFPTVDFFGRRDYTRMPVRIDEETLKKIAQVTDGRYYRATDKKKLEEIYREIDKLEKIKAEVTTYTEYTELFPIFALSGLGFLLLEILLANTRFRKIP